MDQEQEPASEPTGVDGASRGPTRVLTFDKPGRPPAEPHGGGATPAAPGGEAADATASLRAFARCWKPALASALALASMAALLAWVAMPPAKFAARASIHVATAAPRVLNGPGSERADFGTYVRTQVAILKSRPILAAVLARPEVAGLPILREVDDPAEWLERELLIEAKNGSELLGIALKGERPADLAALVNALARAFIEQVEARERAERADRLRNLTENYAVYVEARRRRREQVKDLSERVGSNDARSIAVRQELDLQRLDLLHRELLEVQSDLRRARVDLAVVEARAAGDPARAGDVAAELEADPALAEAGSRARELEDRLASARRAARSEDDPAVRRALDDLAAVRKGHASRREQVARSAALRLGERASQEAASRVAAAREQVAVLEQHERVMLEEVGRLDDESKTLNRSSIGLEESRVEMDQVDEMVRRIAAEIEALKVEQGAPSRVRLFERAEAPPRREPRPRAKVTASVAAGAFGLVLLGFTWRESRAGRVDSSETAGRKLGLKLVGVLPRLSDRSRCRIRRPAGARPDRRASLYFEAIDATRSMVLKALAGRGGKVVLITSALKGEGKTSLACHLAASLARAGRSTLLIDGDMRIPTAHRLLRQGGGPGLAEVLRDEVEAGRAIRPTEQDGLMFLPAGAIDAEALDGLSSGKAAGPLAALRDRFDFILVDSPPTLPVADAILLGRHCDAVLFAVLEDVTCVPSARAAFDRLESIDAPILGAVVAGSRSMNYKYQYGCKTPPFRGRRRPGRTKPDAPPDRDPRAALDLPLA